MKRGALVNLLIGISIVALPLYNRVCEVDFQRTSKDNLLCVILCVFSFLLYDSVRKMSKAMYIALIYGLFIVVFNQHNVLSLSVVFQTFYIFSGVCFFASYYERHDKETVGYILNGMIIGSLIQCLVGIPQYFGINIYEDILVYAYNGTSHHDDVDSAGRVIGTLGNNNLLASYLAITSLAFLSLGRLRYLVIIPIVTMLLNGSMMGILALLAGVFYYLNSLGELFKKWNVYVASMFGMFAAYFVGMGGHDSGRIDIWNKLFEKVTIKHFFFGGGPGWFSDQKILYGGTHAMQEHSLYLSVFNVVGIIGLILLLPIFWKFIFSKDKNKIFASILFVVWCNGFGHFVAHQSTVVLIFIPVLAICLSNGEDNG